MNADLLAPSSSVFYPRDTTGERVPVVGLSSFPECVTISYERSGHTQLYRDCAETLHIAQPPPSPPSPPLQNAIAVFYREQLWSPCRRVLA